MEKTYFEMTLEEKKEMNSKHDFTPSSFVKETTTTTTTLVIEEAHG